MTTPVEVISTLQLLAERFEANYEKIHTWKGTFEYSDMVVFTGQTAWMIRESANDAPETLTRVVKTEHGHGEFVVDVGLESLFTAMYCYGEPRLVADDGHGIKLSSSKTGERSIVTPEHYLHMEPNRIHATFMGLTNCRVTSGRVAFRDPAGDARGSEYSCIVDPRKYLWIDSDGKTFGDYFAEWATRLAAPDATATMREYISISREERDTHSLFHLRIGDYQEMTIDATMGYNVLLMRQRVPGTPKLMSERELTYTEDHGVFVPSTLRMSSFGDDGTSVCARREWSLLGSAINAPIDPACFTYRQLGLKDDERIIDRINDTGYIYNDGVLTEPQTMDREADRPVAGQPQSPANIPVARAWTSFWVFAKNVVLFLLSGTAIVGCLCGGRPN